MEIVDSEQINPSINSPLAASDRASDVFLPTKITLLTMIMYSFPQLPIIAISTALLTYVITLYSSYYKWSLDQSGTLMSLMIISMAVSQPLVGLIVGSSGGGFQTRKFKMYYILSAFTFGAGFILIVFLPSCLSYKMQSIIYFISLVSGITWSIIEVAFASIGANLSTNYDVRSELQTWATIFYTLGSISGHAGHAIVGCFYDNKKELKHRNFILSAIFACILFIALCCFKLYVNDVDLVPNDAINDDETNEVSNVVEKPKVPLKEYICDKLKLFNHFLGRYIHLVTNRYSIALTLLETSNAIFNNIAAYFIYFSAKYLIVMPKFESLCPMIAVISMVLILPFWFKLRAKFNPEKRTTCFFAMLVQTLGTVLTLTLVKEKNLALFLCFLIPSAFSNGIFDTTLQAMKGDVIDYIHSVNDKRYEGEIFGFIFCIKNGMAAIALKLLFYFLEKYGFTGKETRLDPDVLMYSKIIFGILFGIQQILVYIALVFYKIDRKSHKQIISDIAESMGKKVEEKIP